MFQIKSKEELSKDITKIIVEAPLVADKACPGQFCVVIARERGERIPLTLADWDKTAGTITLIFQKIGFSTKQLAGLEAGESIADLLGPLGHPTEIKKFGTVICIGAGVGIAELYPVSRALQKAGNRVIAIIGARTKELLILEEEMKNSCAELFITTDDGTAGKLGLVTDILKGLLSASERSTHTIYPDLVYAIGPVAMMRAVSELTKEYKIKTTVSLNPIMVDATGMCASCRCTVAGKTVYGCVDGPDFDGHQIDFEELEKRLKLFKNEETKIGKNKKFL